jgi:hypothetical protein
VAADPSSEGCLRYQDDVLECLPTARLGEDLCRLWQICHYVIAHRATCSLHGHRKPLRSHGGEGDKNFPIHSNPFRSDLLQFIPIQSGLDNYSPPTPRILKRLTTAPHHPTPPESARHSQSSHDEVQHCPLCSILRDSKLINPNIPQPSQPSTHPPRPMITRHH